MTIRVLIADDDPAASGGLAMLVSAEPDIRVVGEASDGAQAVTLAREVKPDVVLMDLIMPGSSVDGIAATHLLTDDAFTGGDDELVKVLALTSFDTDHNVWEALRAGASGFLLKTSTPTGLVPAIKHVADGEVFLDPAVTRRIVDQALAPRPDPTPDPKIFDRLTPREKEVLRLVAFGMTNDAIAELFVLSIKTVKTHVSRILNKIPAHDRAHAVAIAYQGGLVTRGETPPAGARDRPPGW